MAFQEKELSFEKLLETTSTKLTRFTPGQRVTAPIVSISSNWVFLDLGGKSEGALAKTELLDDKSNFTLQVGDTVTAYFLSSRHNELLFTTRISGGEASKNLLEYAWHNKIPVEGYIKKEIKGGYQVRIADNVMAFCPYSQMKLQQKNTASEYIGKQISFMITEYSNQGRTIILSNRIIVETELAAKKEALMQKLKAGMKIKGTVVSIQKFGAFIDIDGIQGLLPISEICWGRIDAVEDFIYVGQELELIILKLDREKEQISLSLKSALPNPWDTVKEKYPVGSSHNGKVIRLVKFGAFVALENGIDGLIHISALGSEKHINHPQEILKEGESVSVIIEAVDAEKKKLSLKLMQDEKETTGNQDYQFYIQNTPTSLGALGDILKKKLSR